METDTIKKIVEYAESQGSKNAPRYYTVISQLADRTAEVFDRDSAHTEQLAALMLVEQTIAEEIESGIISQKPYKDIYKSVKARLEGLQALFIRRNISDGSI